MLIGIPKEIKSAERRIAMPPAGVEMLVKNGHKVLVEIDGGLGSGFSNDEYIKAGAEIASTAKAVWDQAEMIIKVKEPLPSEYGLIQPDQVLFTFFHFASSKELTNAILETGCVAVAYETVTDAKGRLPLLEPMSEVAGRLAVQEGAKYLEAPMGGRGVLLGGVPGVLPGEVVILGGGTVGINAAKMAAGLGAHVTILDININRLRYLDDVMPANVDNLFSNDSNIREALRKADLVVGAVLIPGAKAPHLVKREMLSLMKPRSMIVDVAIDQGGCVQTISEHDPTTHAEPTFIVEDVMHYAVANMPGAVPLTSTLALTNATIPYALELANKGYLQAAIDDPGLMEGINMVNKKITCDGVSDAFDMPYTPVEEALGL
ncbi:MAG: alanine dehydrogenase [Candidatus Hatepunaea meridiana]|nr:alanine dehydrogenase [Candidatus Hatepunaea meridiana]